jgi:hypothetical protein
MDSSLFIGCPNGLKHHILGTGNLHKSTKTIDKLFLLINSENFNCIEFVVNEILKMIHTYVFNSIVRIAEEVVAARTYFPQTEIS